MGAELTPLFKASADMKPIGQFTIEPNSAFIVLVQAIDRIKDLAFSFNPI